MDRQICFTSTEVPPAAAFSRPPNTQRLAHYVRHPAGQIAADFTLAVFNQHVERLPLVLSPENGSQRPEVRMAVDLPLLGMVAGFDGTKLQQVWP